MTRPILLLLLCLTVTTDVLAAPLDPLRQALADLGPAILYDRALPLAGLPELDGSAAAPVVPAERWRQALHELRLASAPAAPATWPSPTDARALATAAQRDGLVALAVLDVPYHKLRDDTIARGALVTTGDRFVPSPGAQADDYLLAAHAFAATALTPQTYQGEAVRFVLPRSLYVTGGALPIRLELDCDDGLGLRAVALDEPVVARYAATGPRTLRLRATQADGRVLWSRFPFMVEALRTPAPSETWSLTAEIPFEGLAASGEAYVYLADGHDALVNPFVVIEGFDLDDSMGWDVLYALLNQENLLEDLRAEGRDAVILNFASATEPIQRNAYLVVELLQTVQAAIAPGRQFPLVGASMGGLVGRYALTYMEHEALAHGVSTFVSFDAPQRGADIPLGMQYWLDFFEGESQEAAYLLSRLDTPAARQLLLYHHTSPPSPTGVSDPLRTAFLADLAALGDYPAQPRLIAAANGSGLATSQGFAPAAQIVRWEYSSFLVDITGNIWAVPDGSSQLIFDGEIDLIWPLPDTAQAVTVAGTQPWDGAPGGSRASMAEMDAVPAPYGDIVALHPAHAFIPTVSALDLAVSDPFHDVAGDPDLLARTPFAAVYYPDENQPHILITAESKAWFLAELEEQITAVDDPTTPAAPAAALAVWPNPFNPRTSIAFAVEAAGDVELRLFDPRGRLVRTLVQGALPAGVHQVVWDGLDAAGRDAASGVYLVRLETAAGQASARMSLLR